MITVTEAFQKFSSKLELTKKEQEDASRRQQEIRSHLAEHFNIKHDFLTGSYKRWTKTRPLKDVDIFCVLGEEEEKKYLKQSPSVLLEDFRAVLASKYGQSSVTKQRRSVMVEFDVANDERVLSFDVVPAFSIKEHYQIPDTATSSGWTETNPKIHEEMAVQAHQNLSRKWKVLVRMLKKWNEHNGKPIKPSFLIEVMSLELLEPPWGGDIRREIQAYFVNLASHLREDWPDPAGLGPPVSDSMDELSCTLAIAKLRAAEKRASEAIRIENKNRSGALKIWREIFGPFFPER